MREADPRSPASAGRLQRRLEELPGLLVTPREPHAVVALAHGAGAGMRHPFLRDVAEALAEREIATLRWELPYMAAGRARPDRPEVAEAAVQRMWSVLCAQFPDTPRFAAGKSFGGRMTSSAHAAQPLAGCAGLIFLGFPLYPPGKPDAAPARAAHLARASGPMLFLQGTRDELADLAHLRPVVTSLGPRATLHVVDGADHGFDVLVRSGRTHAEVIAELAATIDAWILDR